MADSNCNRNETIDSFLTPAMVAVELNISLSAVYNLIRHGDLQALNLTPGDTAAGRGFYRIRRQWIEDFVARRIARATPETPQVERTRQRARRSPGPEIIQNHLGL